MSWISKSDSNFTFLCPSEDVSFISCLELFLPDVCKCRFSGMWHRVLLACLWSTSVLTLPFISFDADPLKLRILFSMSNRDSKKMWSTCDPIVWTMWDSKHLTTLWAFTASMEITLPSLTLFPLASIVGIMFVKSPIRSCRRPMWGSCSVFLFFSEIMLPEVN
jgi:hypothetical protein